MWRSRFAARISPIPARSSRCTPSRRFGAARRRRSRNTGLWAQNPCAKRASMAARSAFLAAAEERGFIHQLTDRDALDAQLAQGPLTAYIDRKSTRLNSSHPSISYAVFCLKKKKEIYCL